MFEEGGGLAAVVYGVALAFRGGLRRTVTVEGHGIGLNSSILLSTLAKKGAFFFSISISIFYFDPSHSLLQKKEEIFHIELM